MGKYLIQDIVPPSRKHRTRSQEERDKETQNDKAVHAPPPEERQEELVHKAPAHKQGIVQTHHVEISEPNEPIDEEVYEEEGVSEEPEDDGETQNDGSSTFFESDKPADVDLEPTNIAPVRLQHVTKPPVTFPEYKHAKGDGKSWLPWIIISAIVLILGVIILNIFSGATVTVYAKHDSVPLDKTFAALKNPTNGELAFSVMKITLSDTREVPATGEKVLTAKASGKIIVYNEKSDVQRLIKNTRFQSTAGKIYRINESINVPKSVTKAGKTTRGSIEVTVYADEAGPDFNSEPTDFTIPGLKDSPSFKTVYARSKGAISGGSSGMTKSVSDADLKQASEDLRVSLETKLRNKARADIAPTQITYEKSMVIELGQPTLSKDPASSADKAVVQLEGNLYAVTFDRDKLSAAIVKNVVPNFKGENVSIANIDSFTQTSAKMTGDELWNSEKFDFSLKGQPDLLWQIDVDAIKHALVSTPKQSFNVTLSEFPTVERAKATIRPFWKRSFPEDPKKINVDIIENSPK